MKSRLLFNFTLALIFALSLPLSIVQAQTKAPVALTEASVRGVVDAMDLATKKANVPGIIAHMASDISIEMTIETPGDAQLITLTRDQFAMHTKRGFNRRVNYKHARTIKSLTTSKDGKRAMMVSDLFETLTLAEGTINAMTNEILIFALRGGKVMLVSYKSTTQIL